MVIASDTIVELNGQILEKPDGHDGAYKMLSGYVAETSSQGGA